MKTLNGTNAHGVEIVSILLSIDPTGFDTRIRDFGDDHGFDHAGIDCVVEGGEREQVREGFSYYTGLTTDRVPRSSDDRRAFVILNGIPDSSSHNPWEYLYFSKAYTPANTAEVLEIINSIMPGDGTGGGGGGLTFTNWAMENGLPEGTIPTSDSDGDGLSDAVEFYFGTPPTSPDLQPFSIERPNGTQVTLSYPVGKNREGLTVTLEGSDDLATWSEIAVPDENWVITPGETRDAAMITLPTTGLQLLRLSVTVE